MNKIFLSFLFLLTLSSQTNAAVVSQDSLQIENEYLLTITQQLVDEASMAIIQSKVDSSFSNGLIRSLTQLRREAVVRQAVIEKIITSPVPRGRGKAESIQSENQSILQTMQYEVDMAFMCCDAAERVLGMVSAFSKNKKAYFAPGKYLIPYKLRPLAKQAYKAMIDSMEAVVNDFPELSFVSLIRTTGYSDASPTPKGSMLYRDMVQRLQHEPLEMKEINTYLSYLRSYDVAAILKEMTKESSILKNVKFSINRLGKGSQLPDYNETYTARDERRRAVRLYWHILPKF